MIVSALLCTLYYALPGPPTIKIENTIYQLYGINKRLCPGIDPKRDTTFELYTKKNLLEPQQLFTNDRNSVVSSNINFTNPTILFFHGFLETSESNDAVQIRKSYLNKGDYNVIISNSKILLGGPDYITAAINCLPIGQFAAEFVDYLVTLGLNLKLLHIIGMSLGSHVAGLTGKNMKSGKARRLTGLDPAGPLFSLLPASQRISPGDAEFVDILHTNAGFNGISKSSGDVDIWFNGGTLQPGCSFGEVLKRKPGSLEEQVFCNHFQAYRAYIKSIQEPKFYSLTKCTNYNDFKRGRCNSNDKIFLGEEMNEKARGNYYITTGVTAIDI